MIGMSAEKDGGEDLGQTTLRAEQIWILKPAKKPAFFYLGHANLARLHPAQASPRIA